MINANIEKIKNIAMEVHFAYSYRDKHIKYYKLLNNVKKYFYDIKIPKVNDKFSRMLFAKNSKSEYKTFD